MAGQGRSRGVYLDFLPGAGISIVSGRRHSGAISLPSVAAPGTSWGQWWSVMHHSFGLVAAAVPTAAASRNRTVLILPCFTAEAYVSQTVYHRRRQHTGGGKLVSEVGGALNTSVMITDQCTNYKQLEAYRPIKHRQLLDSAKIVCSLSVPACCCRRT